MQKTIILPILAVLNLLLQLVFGIKLDDEILNHVAVEIGNVISIGLVIYGIFKNHKREGKEAS